MKEYYAVASDGGKVLHILATICKDNRVIIHKILEKDTGLWKSLRETVDENGISQLRVTYEWEVKGDKFGTKKKYPEYFI